MIFFKIIVCKFIKLLSILFYMIVEINDLWGGVESFSYLGWF